MRLEYVTRDGSEDKRGKVEEEGVEEKVGVGS